MGKSPARWIKSVLFGKKHSKSKASKNYTPDKKVSARAATEDQDYVNISATPELTENRAPYVGQENGEHALSNTTSSGGSQRLNSQVVSIPLSEEETLRRNQSAANVQAAFRGYLARRAFRALKGIIRLQALIRGHLVRRQAVATLHSMQAILKLQASIRLFNSSEKKPQKYNLGELQVMNYENLASNTCVRKLLRSVQTASPLILQYEESEPNSVLVWLERWSHSRFWVLAHPKKVAAAKSHRKQSENGFLKSKRTARKADNSQNGENSNGLPASHETDFKRNMKKGTNHQSELVHKQPQNELEKVKRNLRKAPASVATATVKAETNNDQPEEQQLNVATESEPKNEFKADEIADAVIPDNNLETAPTDEAIQIDIPLDVDSSANIVELKYEETEEVNIQEDKKVADRKSHLEKREFNRSPSPNTPPSLPSYMAATQSVKAKLRASGSPKVRDAVSEVRRHSLPASTNGKLTSVSPGSQPPSSKGALKANESTVSNREGWKR